MNQHDHVTAIHNNDQRRRQLVQKGFTHGLMEALSENCDAFPLRIWVVDNSGSMIREDGNRLIQYYSHKSKSGQPEHKTKMTPCSRWREIQDTVEYHAEMAALLGAPTIFRLLNDPSVMIDVPQEFSIATKNAWGSANAEEESAGIAEEELRVAKDVMSRSRPFGSTPLSNHVRGIRLYVERHLSPSLREEGKKVAVILATDGLPSNPGCSNTDEEMRDFTESLKELEGLPIWLVIRLCTNDERVVEFYNDLDSQLELSIEVVDFYGDEAEEVYEMNPWLNYTLPLHRMREMGFHDRLFDLLDERKLTMGELREFCMVLFGRSRFDGVPEPDVDFGGFLMSLEELLKAEREQWHPIKEQSRPLISVKKLVQIYGGGGSSRNGACAIM